MRKSAVWSFGLALFSGVLVFSQPQSAQAGLIPLEAADIPVAATGEGDQAAEVAMRADGTGFVVTYESPDIDGTGIYFKRYDANWQLVQGPLKANTFNINEQKAPSIGMDASGNFVIAWEGRGQDAGDSTSQSGIYARRFLADGTAIDAMEFQVNTTTTGNQLFPAVDANASGQFVVAFHSGPFLAEDVFAQSYAGITVGGSGSPTTVGSEVTVIAAGDDQINPAVAIDSSGNYVVVCQSYNQDSANSFGIYARQMLQNGTPVADAFQVNTVVAGDQQNPDIAMDGFGFFNIVWDSPGIDASGLAVVMQRYNASGVAQGGNIQVNSGMTSLNQRYPRISANAAGLFLVTWTGEEADADGTGSDAYRKIYQSAGGVQLSDGVVSPTTAVNDANESDAVGAINAQGDFVITFGSDASGPSSVYLRRMGEAPVVNFAAATSDGSEANNASIALTRSGADYVRANVQTSAVITHNSGSANPGTDFTTTFPISVTFPATGSTTQSFSIGIVNNSVFNLPKTIGLLVGLVTNGSAGSTWEHQYSILNEDPAPGISVEDVAVVEGDSGTTQLTFSVTLSAVSAAQATVEYATADDTALAGSDYTAVSGTLTFQPGETSKTVTVFVTGDTLFEGDQSFVLNLSNPVNSAINDSQAVGTITNDDAAPTFTINDPFVSESEATVTFTVTRTGATEVASSVDYVTAGGTAVSQAGGPGTPDYEAGSGTLVIPPSASTATQTVSFNMANDSVYEALEQFVVNLSNPVGATISDGQGVATISDDDSSPTFRINDVTGSEMAGFTFTVTLSGATALPISVDYKTVDGTAVSTGNGIGTPDYTATSGSLTFSPSASGTQTLTLTVSMTDDTVPEYTEQFAVNLFSPTNGASITDAQGVGTVTDDDPVPSISISGGQVAEGDSGTADITFTVTLSSASAQTVTVNYATQDGTATTADGDYTGSSGPLTFAPGETSKRVDVTVHGDAKVEASETFSVALSGPTNATISTSSATGTITSDDVPSVTSSANLIAQAATTITINGTSFSSTPGENTVAFNLGAVGTVTAATSQTLTVTFTTGPTTGGALTAVVTTLGISSGDPVQVATVDALPVAANDLAYVKKATSIDILVLENDQDSGGDALTITAVSTPTNGTAAIIENGQKIRYTSTSKKVLTDSFTYTIEDIHGNEDTATVTIGDQVIAQAGIYNGLIQPADGTTPSNDRVGLAKITVSKSASTFSVALKLAGQSISTSGAILPDGQVTFGSKKTADFIIKRKDKPDLKLTLKVNLEELVDTLEGELTENGVPFAKIQTERALYTSAKVPVAPYAAVPSELLGTYTVRLAGLAAPNQGYDADQYPAGEGIGVLTVATSGAVKLSGTLADGTTFSYANSLSLSGEWPFYVPTAKGLGSLSGYVRFEEDLATRSDLNGLGLQWYHPANAKAVRYKDGWANGIGFDLLGSKFVLPTVKSGDSVLPELLGNLQGGNVKVRLSSAGFDALGFESFFDLTGKATATPIDLQDPAKVTLSVPRTGYFTGKFKFPSTGKAGTYKGIIFQNTLSGHGFFLGTSEVGNAELIRLD